jgi:site-specific DNA-methyltransferase (adenine-specific)
MKLSQIKPNPENPRVIKDLKFERLCRSIEQFPKMMELRPIVVDQNMVVLGGNMRLKALQHLGFKEIPETWCKKADDLNEDEKRRFIISDNAGFGEWDFEELANTWSEDPLEEWGLDVPNFDKEEILQALEDDFDNTPPKTPITVLGDLYEIGEHRLICGDSTDSDQVAKLMNGNSWNLMATSPPYNQGNSCGNLLHTKGLGTGKKDVKLYEDKNTDNRTPEDYFSFCIDILNTSFLFKNNEDHAVCWNVAYNAKSRNDYGKIIFSDENPFDVKETIIWDKTHSINLPQIGIYSRRCEFVFVMSSNEKYRTSQTYNDCRWNYWQIKSAGSQITGEDVEHRAAYPVQFASKMVSDFSLENDLIYDPFAGSGTTMVASHQIKRKCYGMELDPKYCDVIVKRMIKLDPSLKVIRNGVDVTTIWTSQDTKG